MRVPARVVAAVVLAGLIAACGGGGSSPPPPVNVPANVEVDGTDLGMWGAHWWQWALSLPMAVNPVLDTTGEFGHLNQDGPVWFLAGTFGGPASRAVTIPAGKYVFFPLFNACWWAPEDATVLADLVAGAASGPDRADILVCEVDGVAVPGLDAYRAASPVFAIELKAGTMMCDPAFFGGGTPYTPGVRSPAVADGFWMMLNPLSPGAHTIHFKGGITGEFETEVTYTVTVK